MGVIKNWNKKIKKLDWTDIALIKIGTVGFILTIAKLWTPLLSLNWYWYGIIFLLAATKPIYKIYLK
jgi:hypothetical protein